MAEGKLTQIPSLHSSLEKPDTNHDFAFDIRCAGIEGGPGRVYHVYAESAEERQEWLLALRTVATFARQDSAH